MPTHKTILNNQKDYITALCSSKRKPNGDNFLRTSSEVGLFGLEFQNLRLFSSNQCNNNE